MKYNLQTVAEPRGHGCMSPVFYAIESRHGSGPSMDSIWFFIARQVKSNILYYIILQLPINNKNPGVIRYCHDVLVRITAPHCSYCSCYSEYSTVSSVARVSSIRPSPTVHYTKASQYWPQLLLLLLHRLQYQHVAWRHVMPRTQYTFLTCLLMTEGKRLLKMWFLQQFKQSKIF